MAPRVIDTHAHIILKKVFGMAGKYGPESGVDAVLLTPKVKLLLAYAAVLRSNPVVRVY